MSQHWKFYETMSVSKDSTTTKKMICNIPETNQFLGGGGGGGDKDNMSIVQGGYVTCNVGLDGGGANNPVVGQVSIVGRPSYEDERPPARKRPLIATNSNMSGHGGEYPTAAGSAAERLQTAQHPLAGDLHGFGDGGEDENSRFLMSLLPYLRDVPRHRKLAVRHKLQKVFMDEQELQCATAYVADQSHGGGGGAGHAPAATPSRPPPPPYHRTEYSIAMAQVFANSGRHAGATAAAAYEQPSNEDATWAYLQ